MSNTYKNVRMSNTKKIETEKRWKSIIDIVPVVEIELNDLIIILKRLITLGDLTIYDDTSKNKIVYYIKKLNIRKIVMMMNMILVTDLL